MEKTRNDLNAPVPKFCLAVEEHRRTVDGRVRTSLEFLGHFFPHDDKKSEDRVFRYIPKEVRGPVIATWGIRGLKAALRDPDEKVQSTLHDALVAGDIDHGAFEEGLAADMLVRWIPLDDWWTFWRGGKLSKNAIHKALVTAYELALFDAKWFWETIDARAGKLRGTDVISEGLTKDDLTEWVHKIHQSGEGSPKGILAAIGWDKIVAKTPNEVLIKVLDAMVVKVGLVKAETPGPVSIGGGGIRSSISPSTAQISPTVPPPGSTPAGAGASDSYRPGASDDWPDDSEGKGDAAPTGAPPPGGHPGEDTVNLRGESDVPDPNASDDMIVVLDEDEMSTTNSGQRETGVGDPPTARKLLAASRALDIDDDDLRDSKAKMKSERVADR